MSAKPPSLSSCNELTNTRVTRLHELLRSFSEFEANILFVECRCGLQKQSTMNLVHQSFTGNVSDHHRSCTDVDDDEEKKKKVIIFYCLGEIIVRRYFYSFIRFFILILLPLIFNVITMNDFEGGSCVLKYCFGLDFELWVLLLLL